MKITFSGLYPGLLLVFMLFCLSAIYSQELAINEIMSSNATTIADEDGDFEDWIEIYNYGGEAIDLEGFGLSDKYDDPFRWVFPPVVIKPGEFLLIWASGKDRRPEGEWVNGLFREVYSDIPGSSTDDLTGNERYPDFPDHRQLLTSGFEAPVNVSDHYGQRIHGFIEPPVSGEYVFWISSDDNGRLYLSTDDDPENISEIAAVPGWTNSREWDKYPEQQSAPVFLEAGKLYYIKALMKEHAGGDNLSVRWRLPSGAIEEPVPGKRLFWKGTFLHTNFRISRDGEEILLTSPDSFRIDEVPPTEMLSGISYGRYPDGTGGFLYYVNPTPGMPNHENGLSDMPVIPEPPVFSIKGGQYTSEFLLGLEFDQGLEAYYTTDGSMPVPGTSTLYTQPFPITRTTLVRAIAHEPGGASGAVAAELYTRLSESTSNFTSDLPLLILHQFSTGITAGSRTPAYITILDGCGDERSGTVREPVLKGRVMANIRGSSSQGFPKKMFGFHLIDEDGGNRNEEILGMPADHNWILNGPYSDKSLMRNVIAYGLSNDIGRYAPRTRFVELFLHSGTGPLEESHYHGVYVLTERIKWAEGRVEITRIEPDDNLEPEITGGYIFKNDRLNPGESGFSTGRGSHFAFARPQEHDITPEQKKWLENYLTSFEMALFGNDFTDPAQGYNKYIDSDSFIDAHLITELLKEIDGYRLSTFMHKDRNGKLMMGPLWDFNLCLGNANYHRGWDPSGWYYSVINETEYLYGWYNRLFADPEFRKKYRERWWQLRRGPFSDDSLKNRIDLNARTLDEAQQRNFNRWPIMGRYVWPNYYIAPSWDAEIAWMTNWLIKRTSWMDGQLGKPTVLIHFWHFNDLPSAQISAVAADYSETNAMLKLTGTGEGHMDRVNDGTLINADLGSVAGRALRVRNPSAGRELVFELPTTGYRDVLFRYMVRRTPNGARKQTVYFRLDDAADWIQYGDTLEVTEAYQQFRFDFAGVENTGDNPLFSIRILFHGEGAAGLSGNNRFDNITLEGFNNHFYSKSQGDLSQLETWGTETDGSGAAPLSFEMNMAVFNLVNRESATLDGDLQIGGDESLFVVGNGTDQLNFAVNGILDAEMVMENNASVRLANSLIPRFLELKDGSTVRFSGNALTIPWVSFYNLIIDNVDPVFEGEGEIGIRGSLELGGSVQMPDARGKQRYDLHFSGNADQVITGNGNVIRSYNLIIDKTGGSMGFSAGNGGTVLSADNQIIMNMAPEAVFSDNGIVIYAGNSVNIDGVPDSYNFTGTLILAGYIEGIVNGAGNNNNFNIRDSGSNNSNVAAALNNVVINAVNRDGEFRFRDGTGNEVKIKGDLIIESQVEGRIAFYGNTISIGGNLIIEDGFRGVVDTPASLILDGEGPQEISTAITLTTDDLIISNPHDPIITGEVEVNNKLHFENGKLIAGEGSLIILGTGAAISGYGKQSFVDGRLGIQMNSTSPPERMFPLGRNELQVSLGLEASHAGSDIVMYIAELLPSSPPEHSLPASLSEVLDVFHFKLGIEGGDGTVPVIASMYFDPAIIGAGTGRLHIIKSENGAWLDLGGSPEGNRVTSTNPFTEPGILALAEGLPEILVVSGAGPGGKIYPEGEISLLPPARQSYIITADQGYHIENIFIDGIPLENPPGYFTYTHTFRNLVTSRSIQAEFAPNEYLEVEIFPNPASDRLNVRFRQNLEHVAIVSLVTTDGIVVINKTLAPGANNSGFISIDGAEPGIYIVKIEYGQYTINKKVIIL